MTYLPILIGIAVCLAVGMAAGALQSEALRAWYPHLVKSPLTPPDAVFPVAWTILYVLMGISIGLAWMRRTRWPDGIPDRQALTILFVLQLAANFLWSIVFFTLHSPGAALVDISILFILIVLYIGRSWPHNRAGAWLFVPYAAWVAFAWYLNLYVVLHN